MEQTREIWKGRGDRRGRRNRGWRGGWRGSGRGGGRGVRGKAGGAIGNSIGREGTLDVKREAGEVAGSSLPGGKGRGSWKDCKRGGRAGFGRGGGGRGSWRGGWKSSATNGERGDGRRAGGDTGSIQSQGQLKLKDLQNLKNKSPDDIVLHLTSESCFRSTEYLVKEQSTITDDSIVLLVNIFTKACTSKSRDDLYKLLSLLPGSLFLNLHLRRNLNRLFVDPIPPFDVVAYLRNVEQMMNELLRRFPNSHSDLPLSDLYCAIRLAFDSGQLEDEALVKGVDEMMQMRIEKAEELKRKEEEEKQRKMKPRRIAEDNDDVSPPENFRCLSVVPTQEDILTGGRPFIRKNKVSGAYKDAEHYLDVQFRLLREDFQRPLREGITEFLERSCSHKIGALQDIHVYNGVRLLYPVCTSHGIRCKVEFDNSKLKKVRWENSKRLIFGSLLCLSSDHFENIVFATVANRELSEIRRGTVDIQFIESSDNVRLEESDVYQMVESTSYFEAYRHVLKRLQEIHPAVLPFQKYIVNCQEYVEPPSYLRSELHEEVTFDLTPIMKKVSQDTADTTKSLVTLKRKYKLRRARLKGTSVPLLKLSSWPSAEHLDLDDSQFRALQMALTKEFAVIQGPPGTGKTFIGLKIANVLLHNKSKWDSNRRSQRDIFSRLSENHPILIVCYTNHALDQFLEGIHQFHPEGIVRIGGRTQSETMKKCSLSELKHRMRMAKSVPSDIGKGLYEAHKKIERAESELQKATDGLQKCCKHVFHEETLHYHAQSMTEAHYRSLKQPFVENDDKKHSAMLHWLNLLVNSANPSQGDVCEIDGSEYVEEGEEREEGDGEDKDNEDEGDVLYEANVMENQRLLDDDDEGYNWKLTRTPQDLLQVVNPFIDHGEESGDEWQIQNASRLKKKLKRIMRFELSKDDIMPKERAKMITNVWNLSLEDRWRLYRRWVKDVRERCRREMTYFLFDFERGVNELKQQTGQLDLFILRGANVIGMTTTGAAKYSKILEELQPRITIVEEAAEVLESHILTSLTPGCQHLILIGDHQQLRPNPTVYELAKDYNLDVSLFERMVKNGMPYERLRLQHRMRPEISKMLEHIYFNPKLENHKSVLNFENIMGVTRNVFFVDHAESEDFLEEGRSRSNEHEAKFIAALCRYFILQGYEKEKITVLTAYVGQLTQLKKEMANKIFRGVRVCAVDNFQGEENDIILLSLVRSNEDGKIGFLQIENRVCVALSRAKKGFFCTGNFSLLAKKSLLWNKIINDMRDSGNVGNALKLTCQNHPQNVIHASVADDFKKAPEGGCTVPCVFRLQCGHVCDLMCHPLDPDHKEYRCKKPCTKTLCDLNHKCPKRCFQICGPCREPLDKILPGCGHPQKVPCYLCNDLAQVKCQTPCKVILKCGHECAGDCSGCISSRVHIPCTNDCRRLLFCGYTCSKACARICPPCTEKCSNYCEHNQCSKKCRDPCDPCEKKCVWRCQHYECTSHAANFVIALVAMNLVQSLFRCVIILVFKFLPNVFTFYAGSCSDCLRGRVHQPCKAVCGRTLFCGHNCSEPCTKNCPPCKEKCGNYCKHSNCKEKCGDPCKPCNERCVWQCPHYRCKKLCGELCERPRCNEPCPKRLPCLHPCIGLCGEPCPKKCRECHKDEVTEIFFGTEDEPDARFVELADCGHVFEVEMMDQWMDQADLTQGGKPVDVQHKLCPKCGLPIRTSLRYGNVVKKILADFENIKGNTSSFEIPRGQEVESLLFALQGIEQFPEDRDSIKVLLGQANHAAEALDVIRNQISLLSFLQTLKANTHRQFEREDLPREMKEKFDRKVEQLRVRVMKLNYQTLNSQQLEELNEEMHRTQLLFDFRLLIMQLEINGVDLSIIDGLMKEELDSERKIGKAFRDRYTARIQCIRREQNLQAFKLAILRDKQSVIVNSKCLAQPRWLKCPRGHIWITECGLGIDESKCPDCEKDRKEHHADVTITV